MPVFNIKNPKYKKPNLLSTNWDSMRGGLNTLLRPTELKESEMAVAQNVMLSGSGVATGRWGTQSYFTANATGSIRGFVNYAEPENDVSEILALTDEGYLAKKNGTSHTVITGQSWPSGSVIRSEQLGGKTYIACEDAAFTEYDGTDLAVFATLPAPSGLSASNVSGATGANRISYKITALGPNGGETTASNNYVLEDVPFDLELSSYHLNWDAVSAASVSGYQVYRGTEGDEALLAGVGAGITEYTDNGGAASQTVLPPMTNTTGGIKSNHIKKYKDRLMVVPTDDPNKIMISGRYPYHSNFSWTHGGGYVYIDPDSGDNIIGIEVQPIADRIVVYKEYSSYIVKLNTVSMGKYVILDPTYETVSTAIGCSSQDTIATVENDTFYFGRDGIYVTGYEPNFLNIIRTNEVSARVRPYFNRLTEKDYDEANAMYVNSKYLLSFPDQKDILVYDRERACFAGIWRFPYGVTHMQRFIDDNGDEQWVIGTDADNTVYTFSSGAQTDNGTVINKTMRTGKTYFGDWSRLYIMRFFYVMFRAVIGEVNINILVEDRDGDFSTAKTFEISGADVNGSTGWGMDSYGTAPWGKSNSTTVVAGGNEIKRWGSLFKQASLLQIEVNTTAASSNFEFLGAKVDATAQSRGSLSSGQRV